MSHAILPGSFDPVTLGHLAVIRRTASLFDQVTVVILVNPQKQCRFSTEQRLLFLQTAVSSLPNVSAAYFDGMLVDYLAAHPGAVVVKGVRNAADFSFEMEMATANRAICPQAETLLLPADPAFSHISSTLVRTLLDYGKDPTPYLPQEVQKLPPFVVEK